MIMEWPPSSGQLPVISDFLFEGVCSHSNLESLCLRKTKVGNEGVMAIKSLANLTELDLSKSKVKRGCGAVLSGLGKLSSLNLSRTCINDQDMKFLLRLTNLSSLDIGGTKITDAGLCVYNPLCTSLRCCLGALSLTGIVSLVHLSVSRSRVSNVFMSYVPSLTNLQSLNLSHTQISNQGLRHLRPIKASLTSLSLAGLVVTDQGNTFFNKLFLQN